VSTLFFSHAKARGREEDKDKEEWRRVLLLCGNSRRRWKNAKAFFSREGADM